MVRYRRRWPRPCTVRFRQARQSERALYPNGRRRSPGNAGRREALESEIRSFAAQKGTKLGAVAQPMRAALTGSVASPGIFEVMQVLGRDETLGRIADAAAGS